MKRAAVGAIVLALLIAACGSGESTTNEPGAADTSPIRIGVVGPMTGLAAFAGKNMVEGIQLAIDDINQGGGLLGRRVEFVVRDDEFDPAKTGTAVRELLDKEEVVALFGPASTTSYLAVSRLIQDAKVPSWVIMAGPELSDDVNPYAFRAFIPDSLEIGTLAEYAAKRYQRIAIVTGAEADGKAFADEATAALKEQGRTPVATVTFAQDETDFSPLVLRLKRANADAVILGTHLGLFGSRFAVAKKNLGLDAQVLGVAGLINYTYPDLARDAADDTVFVSFNSWGHLPRDQWPASVREFYEAYVARYLPDGELSRTGAYKAYSTNFLTYDMVQIWAEAVRRARSAEPEKVADVLNAGFTYPAEKSVIGVPWEYSADDHDGIRPGDLAFYRWDLQSDRTFKLDLLGSVTDVLSGKAG